jgi:hypothetical protein
MLAHERRAEIFLEQRVAGSNPVSPTMALIGDSVRRRLGDNAQAKI